jgi:hypothetical protein
VLFCGSFTPGLKPRPPKEKERPPAHPYQNKGFLNQNNEFLSPLFSHRCALLRPYPFCFDMLHKNTQVEGVTPSPIVPSQIGTLLLLDSPFVAPLRLRSPSLHGSAEPLADAARKWHFAAGPRKVKRQRFSRREGSYGSFWQVSYV